MTPKNEVQSRISAIETMMAEPGFYSRPDSQVLL